jgi:hypothetical protein
VKDFLDTPVIWKRIISQSGPDFNADVSLMRSYLLQLKWLYDSGWDEKAFRSLSGEFMQFAGRAEESSGGTQSSYVDQFYETATELWLVGRYNNESPLAWVDIVPSPYVHVTFLHLAIWYGLQYSIDQGSPCPLATLNPFGRELLLSDVFAGLKRSTRIERIL